MLINNILLLIFFLFHKIKTSNNECPKIKCSEDVDLDEKCYSYLNNIVNISLCRKKDDDKKEYFCPIQSDEFELEELKCIKKLEKNNKKYPGGICEDSDDC